MGGDVWLREEVRVGGASEVWLREGGKSGRGY